MVQAPVAALATVVAPSGMAPANSWTIAPWSAVPVNVGVVSAVSPSDDENPVSLAGSRTGAEGAPGARVSVVTVRPGDGRLTSFDALVAVAVIRLDVLAVRATFVVTVYAPLTVAVSVPMSVPAP